jgi:membrane-associated phospholipid phosphatase
MSLLRGVAVRWAALLFLLAAVVTWQVLSAGRLTHVDISVQQWSSRHSGLVLRFPWDRVSRFGRWSISCSVVLVAATCVSWRCRSLAPFLQITTTLAAFLFFVRMFKVLVGRAAPWTGVPGAWTGGDSFPSGHTAVAVITSGLLFGMLGGTGPGIVLGAAVGGAVGIAMIVPGQHWMSDVLESWLLAMAVLVLSLDALRGTIVERFTLCGSCAGQQFSVTSKLR